MLLTSAGHEQASDAAEIDPKLPYSTVVGGEGELQQRGEAAPGPDLWHQLETELPFLRRAVRRWHREKADADDLVQDTLVQALANAQLWQPGSNLRAWLFTIMRNRFFAMAAKSNRLAAVLQDFAHDEQAVGPDPGETRLILRDVQGAFRRLPSNQRLAIHLVCIEEKSYEEAARLMGLSVAALRCHLARGRARLRVATRAGEDRSPFVSRPALTRAILSPANRSVAPPVVEASAD
jgi:RNA polymerase sigma-70 factor (ECF subfamily)